MYDYFTKLSDFLTTSTQMYADKTALITTKQSLTFRDINKQADCLAQTLLNKNIERGDRIVVCLANRAEVVISFWAAIKIGAVISIINPAQTADKIAYVLKDSGASVFISDKKHYHLIADTLNNSSVVSMLVDYEELDNSTVIPFNSTETINCADEIRSPCLDVDLASIIYTSGSTGDPKGVMLSHRNMLAAATSINQYLDHDSNDIILSVLPMAFDYGLYQMIMACSVGATLVLKADFTWPMQMLKKIDQYQVSVLPVVPTMVPILYEFNSRFEYDLSSIRCITNTGAALNIKHIQWLREMCPQADIFSMYGLTECKRCSYLPPTRIDSKAESVGIAIPNTELFIVSDDGRRVGPNVVGQLVIRGATVMQGYWNKPEETKKKLKPGLLPDEKVLYTGDYAWIDDDGFLYYYGRMDEIFKCKGIKVSPKSIESILMQKEGVKEVAVIGIEDELYGHVIILYVAASDSLNELQLEKYCKHNLPDNEQPYKINILGQLPKNTNGKIDKLALKNMFLHNNFRSSARQAI